MKTQHGTPESSSGSLPSLLHPDPSGEPKVPVLHSEREHSKISPSKLKSLELCPGFLDDPNREVHAITLVGTKCHEALDSGDFSKLTDEERSWVDMCRNYVRGLVPRDTAVYLPESRLEIMDGIWGFADLIIVESRKVHHLVDYKFGLASQSDVSENPAAQAYVLGMFQKWPDLDTIHVHYLYPRREEISKHTYTRKDVLNIRLRIQTIVDRVRLANAAMSLPGQSEQLTPVPDNCQWCARKATCAALHKMVLPLATRYAGRHDISLVEPDFSMVKSPEQWAALLPYAPVLEQMSDSIKRHALEFREQTGQEIPGYEVRSRKGKAKIINADVAYQTAADFVTHDEFMRCTEVSAAKLREVVEEKAPKGQKSKVAKELEGRLRDAGVLEEGKEAFFLARSRK